MCDINYYNCVMNRMMEENMKLNKENNLLIMKNAYQIDYNKREIEILRREKSRMNIEIIQMKKICNELSDKNRKMDEIVRDKNNSIDKTLSEIKYSIMKIRDFQAQDYVARQNLELKISKFNEENEYKNLEKTAVNNAMSFLSTL